MIKKYIDTYRNMNSQARAGIWFVFCSFFQKGVSFITIPIFTRILTTDEYGVTNVFNAWSTLLIIFATLNLSGGVYNRGLLEFKEKPYTSAVQGLATTSSIIVAIILFIFKDFFCSISGLSLPIVYTMIAYFTVIAGLNLWTVKQRFFFKYRALIATTIANTIISTGFGIIAVLISSTGRGEAKVIWSTVGLILVALPFYVYNFKQGKTFYDKKMWKYSLAFNLPLLPHYVSNLVLHQSDRIMINWFSGLSDVALYSVAYSVSSLANVFTDSVNQTITPWRYQRMKARDYAKIKKTNIALLILVAIITIAANLLAPEIIYIFGGSTYSAAVWAVPPIMLSVYFVFMYSIFSNVEFYFLKTKFMMVASLFSAGLNIILNYIFINIFGYIACAYTSLFCYMVYALCHYLYARHILKKEIHDSEMLGAKEIIVITIFTVLLAIASTLLYNYTVVRYMLIFITVILSIIFRNRIKNVIRIKNGQ